MVVGEGAEVVLGWEVVGGYLESRLLNLAPVRLADVQRQPDPEWVLGDDPFLFLLPLFSSPAFVLADRMRRVPARGGGSKMGLLKANSPPRSTSRTSHAQLQKAADQNCLSNGVS